VTKEVVKEKILKRLEEIVEAAESYDFETNIRDVIAVKTVMSRVYHYTGLYSQHFIDIRLLLTAKRDVTKVISTICRNFA
jgi:hypothetical protein